MHSQMHRAKLLDALSNIGFDANKRARAHPNGHSLLEEKKYSREEPVARKLDVGP